MNTKFRAWDKKTNKMYPVDSLAWDSSGNLEEVWLAGVEPTHDETSAGVRTPDEVILEQSTGSFDRNDKEVYDSDIVEEEINFNSKGTDGIFRYKVYWNEDELCWSLDPIGPGSIHNDLWELNSSCRVIGNVHEKPRVARR